MAKDKCVSCGAETPYDETTHIDRRQGYIEGCGQLCRKCAKQTEYDYDGVRIPRSMIDETPNNYDLGEKVRKMLWDLVFPKVK